MYSSKPTYGRKTITPKTKKSQPYVDLTAMVNLSFLLMMFFMLQSFMKKPNAMDLDLPVRESSDGTEIGCGMNWRTLTILLGENNTVVTYLGMAQCPLEKPKVFKSGSLALKNEILAKNEYIKQFVSDPNKEGLTVIIKPSDKSIYCDLVAALENASIARNYFIDDHLKIEEEKLLHENK